MKKEFTRRILALTIVGFTTLAVLFALPPIRSSVSKSLPVPDKRLHSADDLSMLGINKYISRARANKHSLNKIDSRWAVRRFAETHVGGGKLESEQGATEFEITLAMLITEQAGRARATRDAGILVDICTNMIEAAAWVLEEQGYGNMLLAARSYDVASLCVIKLAADDSFPLKRVQALVDKFDWSWGSPENRRRILHEATNGKYFEPRLEPCRDEDLAVDWAKCRTLYQQQDEKTIPPELEIFGDDRLEPGESLFLPETTWNKPAYRVFAQVGFGSVNYRNALVLCKYRQEFGGFPAELADSNARSIDEFDKVFEKVIWKKPVGFGGVFAIYYAYKNNLLVDVGYSSSRRNY